MYRLREIEDKDIPLINHWRNDRDMISMLGAPFRYINRDTDIKWYENYLKSRSTNVRCAIVEKDEDVILGIISLTNINFQNQSAELHLMIGKENQGKGLGTFSVNELLYHAFNNLNLKRVELTVLKTNIRAIHLYEKCGFVKEGCKRQSKYKNGKFVDMLMYSILKDEWCEKNNYI